MMYPWLASADAEFRERLEQQRLPHALLLSGPRGAGKTELAESFMAGVLCLENDYPACGSCRSCQLLAGGAHPDRQVVTFEEHPRSGELRKEIVVDQVRRLIASLNLTNTISPFKAALIHPAEGMNTHAANALLKTLEEPPGKSFMILVAHDAARLPATIRSRCQNLHVRPPEPSATRDWLCTARGLEPAEAELALQASAGSPLLALQMHAAGTTDQYRLLTNTLEELYTGRTSPGAAMAALADIEPDALWSWISLLAADRFRAETASHARARRLSGLQLAADRNRKLAATPVRKDFLLQDWLIQWAGIGA